MLFNFALKQDLLSALIQIWSFRLLLLAKDSPSAETGLRISLHLHALPTANSALGYPNPLRDLPLKNS
ncbi:MAG: hypothetical protein A2038_08085 [Deltaproteobacteria bacterium GWA2_57_13]|nr:MAG: hypothetical protein A2038_08085 [Deltaproteobacteria bacterium GWA2_57_13]OGQ75842.1 MAG: hypothetical protein A3G40_09945 [Deltaproteobacteria bacterium RIFCSPLOWO2_12_FULL_57_22]